MFLFNIKNNIKKNIDLFSGKIFLSVFSIFVFIPIIYPQSLQDFEKLKKEYEKSQKNEFGPSGTIPMSPDIQDLGSPQKATVPLYKMDKFLIDTTDVSLNYFGYNFFTKRDSMSFWENLPTPPDYLLGPGDELVISLWGETQLRKTYIVNRDGKIYDDKVGVLNIMGKSIESAGLYFKNQFGRVYATLNGRNPSTYIDVSLGKLRSINVNFVGEVNYPGVYPIHPFSTLITGLIQAGGVDTTGSLRKIEIRSSSGLIRNIDLYDYFLKGELPKNIQLRDQDVIFVPVRLSSVMIDSNVFRPGIYES